MEIMGFFTYILIGRSKKITKTYVGWTNNLQKRLISHNKGSGAKSTKGYYWKVIYVKRHKTKIEAMKYEYYLKKISPLRNKLKAKYK